MEALLIFLTPISASLCGILLGAYIVNKHKEKKSQKKKPKVQTSYMTQEEFEKMKNNQSH